ncbi:hypothetical protein OROGR_011090 [Orobanche gracilis]
MARGRTRKPRLSRMDAAVDAMVPLGFPEEKVRKCVKELLKVYGGDAGWPFVEEYAYKELIEAMLRDEEQVTEDGHHLKKCTYIRITEKLIEDGSGAGTSTRVSERQQDEEPENNSEANIVWSLDAVSEPKSTDIISTLSLTYYDKTVPKENECGPKTHVPSRSPIPFSQWLNCSTTHTLQPINNGAPHRRQPCYGWIESDDDVDIDDFVFLEPANAAVGAILPQEVSKVRSDGTKTRARRQSRWDLRPDDP